MGKAPSLVGEQGLRFLHPAVVTKVEQQAQRYLEVGAEQPLSSVVPEEREWGQIRPDGPASVGKEVMKLPEHSNFAVAWSFGCLSRQILL